MTRGSFWERAHWSSASIGFQETGRQAVIKYFSYFERGTEAKILLQEFVFHDGSYPPLKMRFSPENIHYFLEITYFPKELKQNYQKIHHPSKAYCEIHI